MSSNLTACQPGWMAVFQNIDGGGYTTEPIACWLLNAAPGVSPTVHPICAMGGDICDASEAENYLGVVGPGTKPESLLDTKKAAKRSA